MSAVKAIMRPGRMTAVAEGGDICFHNAAIRALYRAFAAAAAARSIVQFVVRKLAGGVEAVIKLSCAVLVQLKIVFPCNSQQLLRRACFLCLCNKFTVHACSPLLKFMSAIAALMIVKYLHM